MNEIIIPSSAADRQKIKEALTNIKNALQSIEDEKSAIKDIVDMLKENHDMPPKLSRSLGKSMLKHNFSEIQTEYENFESAYEILIEGRSD